MNSAFTDDLAKADRTLREIARRKHARAIDSSLRSITAARALADHLADLVQRDESNDYAADAWTHATDLVGEMEDSLDHDMSAAIADGFGPEDFA